MGCSCKYDDSVIEEKLFKLSIVDDEPVISTACYNSTGVPSLNGNCLHMLCGWCCGSEIVGENDNQNLLQQQQQQQQNVAQNRAQRNQTINKDSAAFRDMIGRLSRTTPLRSYVFQHLDVGDHMTSYREQLASPYAASSDANLSVTSSNHVRGSVPLLLARHQMQPQQQQQQQQLQQQQPQMQPSQPSVELDDGVNKTGINTTYFNGVWSVAQKYNLPRPSLTQCATWWRSSDKQMSPVAFIDSNMPEMSDTVVNGKRTTFSHSAGSQSSDMSARGIPQAVAITRRGSHKKTNQQLTIGDQVDQFTKRLLPNCYLFVRNSSGTRQGYPDLVLGGATGLDVLQDMGNQGNQIADKPRLSAAARAQLRDATCPQFMRTLVERLTVLERKQRLAQPPPGGGPRRATTAVRPRKGSSALEITGKVQQRAMSAHPRAHNNKDDRPSLPSMPYFRCGSTAVDGR